jgi:hypothetical protein
MPILVDLHGVFLFILGEKLGSGRTRTMRSPGTMLIKVFVLALAISACNDSGETVAGIPPIGSPPTSYIYRGYNSKDILVVTGSMTLALIDSISISGTWMLECIVPGEKVGPQTGSGTLRGSLQGGRIMVDLNPGWADNNVFLSGSFDKDRISGTWMWSTFVGPTSKGKFEAVKNH